MARSYSSSCSAFRPAFKAALVAHADNGRASAKTSTKRLIDQLFARAIGDYVGPLRDAERKLLIGYARVFLQVRERQGRLPTLLVFRGQRSQLQRLGVDGHDQVLVLRLWFLGRELQSDRARRGIALECSGEVPHDL